MTDSLECILFVPSVRETEWVSELFPGRSPSELPIAGRRIIDYGIEHAMKFDVVLTGVLDWHYSKSLAEEYLPSEEKGYAVFYEKFPGDKPPCGLDDLVGVSSTLTQNLSDGLVVVWGLCLSDTVSRDVIFEPVPPEECARTPLGVYRRVGGKWMRIKDNGIRINGLKAWHETNFMVLHDPGQFTLPGYSAEKNVHLGRNVVIEHGSNVKAPVLLCDNTWFARNVSLDGDVIVSSGSFVGEGTRLKRTVVGLDTYIGTGLDFENKIVIGNRVIDPDTGVWMDMEEPGLARRIGTGFTWLRKLWHFLRGKSYGRLG